MADRPAELPVWTPVPANAGYFSKPPLALVNNGYNDKESPDPGIFNYQFHQIFKWVEYLDQDKVSVAKIDVNKDYVDKKFQAALGYTDALSKTVSENFVTNIRFNETLNTASIQKFDVLKSAVKFPSVGENDTPTRQTKGVLSVNSIAGTKKLQCCLDFSIPAPDPNDNDPFWCFLVPPAACPKPFSEEMFGSELILYNTNDPRQIGVQPYSFGTGILYTSPVAVEPITVLFGRLRSDDSDSVLSDDDYERLYIPVLIIYMNRALRPSFSPSRIYAQWEYTKS